MATVIFTSPAAYACMKEAFCNQPEVHIVQDNSAKEPWRFGPDGKFFERLKGWASVADDAVSSEGLNKYFP